MERELTERDKRDLMYAESMGEDGKYIAQYIRKYGSKALPIWVQGNLNDKCKWALENNRKCAYAEDEVNLTGDMIL